MVATDKLFAGSIPEIYDRFLVPPHGYHDMERIRTELRAAGFAIISVDALDRRSKASSPSDVAVAYCQGTPLRNEIEARDASRLDEATERTAEALARRFGDGVVDARIRAFVITAGNRSTQ
jgi:uncharacterized protein (DUF2126 family)